MSDWWFNKLATGKHSLFWQAHSRAAYFSEQTKDFINKVLHPDPAKRISIADMRKHPWFEGPIISDTALVAELNRRKNDVDEAKLRAKQEKKLQQQQAAAMRSESPMNAVAVRDIDDMPSAPPSFMLPHRAKLDLNESSALFNPFAQSPFDDEPKPTAVPPVHNPKSSNVACYTRFESTAKAGELTARLVKLIEEMKGQYTLNDKKFFLKATVLTGAGSVTFTSRVFSHATEANRLVCEFRRRKGDSIQFRNIFYECLSQVSDILAPAPKKAVTTTTATAAAPVASK